MVHNVKQPSSSCQMSSQLKFVMLYSRELACGSFVTGLMLWATSLKQTELENTKCNGTEYTVKDNLQNITEQIQHSVREWRRNNRNVTMTGSYSFLSRFV